MKDITITVFFDYTCPWVRQAGIWLRNVQQQMGPNLNISWKCFLLEQVNTPTPDWRAWEQGDDYVSRGIWPHRGGLAARMQGTDAHWQYAMALFEAKHVERQDVRSYDAIAKIAETADLDMEHFTTAAQAPERLTEIATEHSEAAQMEIFGTPTIIPQDGMPIFLKTFAPPDNEAIPFFNSLIYIARQKWCGEIKRPQPPWPRGV